MNDFFLSVSCSKRSSLKSCHNFLLLAARYILCSVFYYYQWGIFYHYHYQCRQIFNFKLKWVVTSRVRDTEIKTRLRDEHIFTPTEICDLEELRVLAEHRFVWRCSERTELAASNQAASSRPWKQTHVLQRNAVLLEGKAVHCSVRFNLDERFAHNLDATVFRCVWE